MDKSNTFRGIFEDFKSIPMLKELPEYLHHHIKAEAEEESSYACLICGTLPFFIGYLEKSNPNRMLVYCLCFECYEKPESEITVEKIIDYHESARLDNPNLLDLWGEC